MCIDFNKGPFFHFVIKSKRSRKFSNICCNVGICAFKIVLLKMAAESDVLLTQKSDINLQKKNDKTSVFHNAQKKKETLYAGIFLSTVTVISGIVGFGYTLSAARKQDPKFFSEGMISINGTTESGPALALRALRWGTIYAVTGCGILFYGIWKISGAKNAEEFRYKMGSILPRIPKNDPPQSRTEFEGLTDLLTYISEDWGKKKD